ncbi:MAG TPA: gluconate:H+ symporter, partial [Bryobacterales bacterium]|nr:gluconate:H+ symporter [Bryobacterales bacterium]
MTGNALIILTLLSIGLLLLLILVLRLHAFLALLISAMALGAAAGMPLAKVLKSVQFGFGDALGFIAVVVGLGAIIGRFIEVSGGGQVLADWLLDIFGRDRAAWAVLATSFLLGLPIFFEVGFIILVPIVWNLGRETRRSLLFYGMPMIAALTTTHALIPPHPAPSAAAQLLGADLGRSILYGIAVGIPMAITGGILYGGWIAKRLYIPVPAISRAADPVPALVRGDPPAAAPAIAPPDVKLVLVALLLPIAFIFAASISELVASPASRARHVLGFFGHPFTALIVASLFVMIALGVRRGSSREQITKIATDALAPTATLLLIMGGGGAFKQVIVDSGVGAYAGQVLAHSRISPLLVAYIIAASLRIAQGSATVAIITAAGILAPIVKGIPGYKPEILVLAVGTGGTILSHVNDAGFWLIKEYFGMTVPDTLRSWSVMKVIIS